MPSLLERIEDGAIDSSFVVTHRMELGNARRSGMRRSSTQHDECVWVVLEP
jgi:threonine dehydrogenase-like Zn-dependent dehydrogenase